MTDQQVVHGVDAASEFEVDLQPDVSALRMFRSMSFTPWYALGEFVDNSITSALKNAEGLRHANGPDYQLRVDIEFEDATGDLVVTDNAAGITRSDMNRALRMGKRPEDTSIGLSRHGVGLKAAAFWWGSQLEVETYPLGEPGGWSTTINVASDEHMDRTATVRPIPSRGYSGTIIRVKNLWQKTPQRRTKGAIRSYLPSIYRQFLGGGTGLANLQCRLRYDGTDLTYSAPPLLIEPFWPSKEGPQPGEEPLLWKKDFHVELATGKRVTGWYGILETMSRDGSGFFLHYRGKGIAGVVPMGPADEGDHTGESVKDAVSRSQYKPREIFGQSGHYRDQRIIGEFDVSDFGKTISTDAPLWSFEEEQQFVVALKAHMEQFSEDQSLLRMALNYRPQTKSRAEKQRSQKIQVEEANRAAASLAGKVAHVEADDEDVNPYKFREPDTPATARPEPDQTMFTLSDPDGHTHTFVFEYRQDRSADFIVIREDRESLTHTVRINALHPILNDMPQEEHVERLVTRLAEGLAAAEVFATFRSKHQIRETMNDYLRHIGMSVADG